VRIGLNVGRTTARGVKIEGTEDAIRREMNEGCGRDDFGEGRGHEEAGTGSEGDRTERYDGGSEFR